MISSAPARNASQAVGNPTMRRVKELAGKTFVSEFKHNQYSDVKETATDLGVPSAVKADELW